MKCHIKAKGVVISKFWRLEEKFFPRKYAKMKNKTSKIN
jgi:hypothetical protein